MGPGTRALSLPALAPAALRRRRWWLRQGSAAIRRDRESRPKRKGGPSWILGVSRAMRAPVSTWGWTARRSREGAHLSIRASSSHRRRSSARRPGALSRIGCSRRQRSGSKTIRDPRRPAAWRARRGRRKSRRRHPGRTGLGSGRLHAHRHGDHGESAPLTGPQALPARRGQQSRGAVRLVSYPSGETDDP